ncbi:ABC transporter ATP-binding protein/permease [Mycolicibacterium sp. 050158]|uniref:ABC transporter ATP-binding protein/permease n=1 Tax=Mycolicibacterium sp. 050158 TaxID=3090602 RepID=UPI00299DDB62|nr:ABC transporter ATP-binding protein/permease [Mycolicibacterium sp. 050158]MDX1891700.1 ABC transporter ATP-binding protein/permease [Mycolicibacterium sp. 050158]
MDLFVSSIDWNGQLTASMWWISCTWSASAAGALVVGVALIRFTTWGRRFWRVTGGFFTGRRSVRVWAVLAVLLFSVVTSVRLAVLMSYYNNDLFSALQTAFQGASAHDLAKRDSGIHGFWIAIAIFCVLATITVVRIVLDTYLTQRFIIAWRVWLTDRLCGDWLDDDVYYRTQLAGDGVDNPDQRIQQDIDVLTTGVGASTNVPSYYSQSMLPFGALNSVISVASFAAILWRLSGTVTVLEIGIPRALFWIVILYVLVASAITFRIGRPLIALSYRNEQTNAAFRYAMIRVRDAAEAVAFIKGARAERRRLDAAFGAVIGNYRRYLGRTLRMIGWNYSVTQAITPLPFLVQAPRLFAGAVTLGDVMQSGTAFGKIESGLSFFRNAYSQFASYDATIVRLDGLMQDNARARRLPRMASGPSVDGLVRLDGVEVRSLAGDRLVASLDLQLRPGEWLVVSGRSGTGKTTMLRGLAGMWPAVGGRWHRPDGRYETMFVSQLLYMPLGELRSVVCYPHRAGDVSDERLRAVLSHVLLDQLNDRLDEARDWAKVLSPGEQQRVSFARVLLTRPKVVFLDEATSALDEGVERALYRVLRDSLPNLIVINVSHHGSVHRHHDRHLELLGDGGWRLHSIAAPG